MSIVKRSKNKGVVALITILLVGGIIVEIGIAGLFVVYLLTQSSFGLKLSAEALSAAQTGLQDALLRIVRNKDFSYCASPCSDFRTSGYSIALGSGQVQITVCQDRKTALTPCDTIITSSDSIRGKDEITSLGIVLSKTRILRAFVNINKTTGQTQTESIQEISL